MIDLSCFFRNRWHSLRNHWLVFSRKCEVYELKWVSLWVFLLMVIVGGAPNPCELSFQWYNKSLQMSWSSCIRIYSTISFNNSNLRHLLCLIFYQMYLNISNLPPAFKWFWKMCNFIKLMRYLDLNLKPIMTSLWLIFGLPCDDDGPMWRMSLEMTNEMCEHHSSFINPLHPDGRYKAFCNANLSDVHYVLWLYFFSYYVLWVMMGGERVRTESDSYEEFYHDPLAWNIFLEGGLVSLMENLVGHDEMLSV